MSCIFETFLDIFLDMVEVFFDLFISKLINKGKVKRKRKE